MLISELRQLIKAEKPCISGYEWFNNLNRKWKCKTAVGFFKKCKAAKFKKPPHTDPYTPYGYLIWIFGNCLDWKDVCGSENGFWYHKINDTDAQREFLRKNFGVVLLYDIPTDKLCDALIRAFFRG